MRWFISYMHADACAHPETHINSLTTRMRVPRHSASAWRSSRLRMWKNRESLSKYCLCLPIFVFCFLFAKAERRHTHTHTLWMIGFPEWLVELGPSYIANFDWAGAKTKLDPPSSLHHASMLVTVWFTVRFSGLLCPFPSHAHTAHTVHIHIFTFLCESSHIDLIHTCNSIHPPQLTCNHSQNKLLSSHIL